MGRVANPKLASLWRERVERQRRSGLSILEYCRREGFSAGSFHAWKRRLRGVAFDGREKVASSESTRASPAIAARRLRSVSARRRIRRLKFASPTARCVSCPPRIWRRCGDVEDAASLAVGKEPPMLSAPSAVRIFAYALPTDMRKSFDGLHAIVTHEFTMDVLKRRLLRVLQSCASIAARS